MSGYSLEQLRIWCLEDQLIDSFRELDGRVQISYRRSQYDFSTDEALGFLKAIFRNQNSFYEKADNEA
jgi:hypothetical protein